MAKPVIRVSEEAYADISHMLIKRRDNGSPDLTMAALGDEIAIAGLAWLNAGGRVSDGVAVPPEGVGAVDAIDMETLGRAREAEAERDKYKARVAQLEALAKGEGATTDGEEDREASLSRALRNLKVKGPQDEAIDPADGAIGSPVVSVLALIDAETERWNTSKRGTNAQRGRVETVVAMVSTSVRRWHAANAYGKRKAAEAPEKPRRRAKAAK